MKTITRTFMMFAGAASMAALAVSTPLASLPAAAQGAPSADLQQVVTALRGISTLRADFTQTDRNGQRVGGQLTIKQPGKIRFQYQKDVRMLIVGDGKSLTYIDYEIPEVQRWPIGNSPLGALLDPRRDVARFGKLQPTGNPDVISVEVRDSKHPEYGIITLIFSRKASAPGGLELVNWVMLDSQNKRTTIRLTNHRYGVPVSENDFRWKDPRSPTRR